MVGFGLGLIPVIIILALLFSSSEDLKVEDNYKPVILPNGNDVRKKLSKDSPVILKLNVQGVIGLDELTSSSISDQLTESREGALKSDRVKAVLVYINTPGGTVTDSNGIYQAIKSYKERHEVPVYAYIDGLCASGGMYVASACDKIFANNASIVGSVGVLSPTMFNAHQLMEKIGVESKTITAGKNKDAMNPFRPWKPGEEENIQSVIQAFYEQFVDLVVENRPNMDREKLVDEYGANIFDADKAVELGYIDQSNTSLNDTIKALTTELGIKDDYYQVVEMESKIWYRGLIKGCSPIFTGKIQHEISGFPELAPEFRNQFLYLYQPE